MPAVKNFNDIHVTIIDRHDPIRKGVIKALAQMDIHNYSEFFNFDKAADFLKANSTDIIIADIYAQGDTGLDFVDKMSEKEIGSETPFLVITGEANKEKVIQAADKGIDKYILKPFLSEDIKTNVTDIINNIIYPSVKDVHLKNGERFLYKKEYEKAIEEFKAALKIDPKSSNALYGISVTHKRTKNIDKAIKLSEMILKDKPQYFKSLKMLANIFLENRNNIRAIHFLKKELELNKNQPKRLTILANLLLKEGEADEAISFYRESLIINNKFVPALEGIAKAFQVQENYDKAIYYYKRIRRNDQTNKKALQGLIEIGAIKGDMKIAIHVLKDEVVKNKDNFKLRIQLANVLMLDKKDDEAAEVLDKVLKEFELSTETAEAYHLRAKLYFSKGDFKEALDLVEKALSQSQEYEWIKLQVACHIKLENIAQAIKIIDNHFLPHPKLKGNGMILLLKCCDQSNQQRKAYFCALKANSITSSAKLLQELESRRDGITAARRNDKLAS